MIDNHIQSLKKVRDEVRNDAMKSQSTPTQRSQLTYIFTVLTSLIDKYTEDEEETKLTDGTERYHR